MYTDKDCQEPNPGAGQSCFRYKGHTGDHMELSGVSAWPNAASPRTTVELDLPELLTLWSIMTLTAPNHVRYDRINAKLTAALKELGEDVE